MAKELIETDVEVLEPEEKEYSLSGGKFFEEHPEKILAEPYEASGRFGTVTKYRPKAGKKAVDVLKEIDTPVFIGHGITDISAGSSVIITKPEDIKVTPEVSEALDNNTEESEKSLIKRQRSEKRKLQEFYEPAPNPTIPFDDIVRNYNPDLTEDEIKAFLWYMHTQGNTYKGKWLNYFNPTILSQEQESAYINTWVKSGILFYFSGELIPAFAYLGENLYERKAQLEKDRDSIVKIYGEDAYKAQENKLNEAFQDIYNNRLKLDDPDPEKRLHLKPYGDFTNSIQVKNWNIDNNSGEPAPFYVPHKTDGSINWYASRDYVRRYGENAKQTLSINDAFRFWLKYDSNKPDLPYNFRYEDIFWYYLDKRSKKDVDPTVMARNRALTKEVGDKFFSQFLAEIILENDRVKIETLWNEQFNGDRGINTDKIPVGFECALNYPGDQIVEIRDEKREGVAFACINGSSLNAYQVGLGKANLLTSDILTPKGWVKMKDIKPEMEVIGKNGKPTKVLEIFPQGEIPAYRVTFSDGSYTEVTGDHLWDVQNCFDRYTGKWRTLPTLKIAQRLYNGRGERIYSIPMVEPVQFEHKDIPIDPYLLGALIGDGGLTARATFSNPETEIQNTIRKIVEGYGLALRPENSAPDKDFSITKGNNPNKSNIVFDSLKDLGLIGKKSIDKFIPDLYLYNSIDVRLALMQGLFDTDGYTDKSGSCTQISTSSKRLAENIVELIRSFGGTVNEHIKHPKYTYKGELKEGHEAYILTVRLPHDIVPFTTQKHLSKFQPKTKYIPVRYINSIEPIGKHEAQCILVDAPDHLYVCDEYIVTHNTWSSILTIAQFLDAEHCKRPVLIVPNQVYKQFYSELHGILPHRKINDFYNLGVDYYEKLLDDKGNIQEVDEGSITMLTYEGFEQIGFNPQTADYLLDQLKDAIMQITSLPEGESKAEEKIRVRQEEKIKGLLGKALQKTKTNIEDLGFDFVCFDEAHALKNIFSQVKGRGGKPKAESEDKDEKGKRAIKMYEISGSTSTRGLKAYMLCSYIQLKNRGRNILLLTATPFTNTPLEVYSMLSLVAYQHLRKIGLSNLNDFFDNYCEVRYELVLNHKLQPVRKQVFKSFDNLQSLQKLIYKFMLHKEAGKPDKNGKVMPPIARPDKWFLPYKGRFNDINEFIPAKPEEMIDTTLSLTAEQKELMDEIISYVQGDINYNALSARGQARFDLANMTGDEDEEERKDIEEALLDEGSMDDKEKAGVKALRGMSFSRALALSPYLYVFSGLGTPTYKSYVEKSPKLKYIMDCVKSVKEWHEAKKEPVSGQVIYMDRGKDYFELLKEYLVKVVGYKPHEIGIIRSGKEGSAKHKDTVKNAFNGVRFDENTKMFERISDEERIKIVIGTSSIKEGLNLQVYGTCLYNAFVDWNPTDEIQLEGRMWRQGNIFKNCRIVMPMMLDSMDIFMFQKLEEKTERINSIWNYDGRSNVLRVEELDPREIKLALVTDPKVIAQMEVEGEETKLNEEISVADNKISTANNLIGLFEERETLEKELTKVLKLIDGKKDYPSLESMISRFEKLLKDQDEKKEVKAMIKQKLSVISDRYEYKLTHFNYSEGYELYRPWNFGTMKGAVNALRKAKKTFFERYKVMEDVKAVEDFIKDQENRKKLIEEDIERLKSEEFITERAKEIEKEREEKQIKFVPVEQRVKEFETLNYLLGIKRDKKISEAEYPIMEDIKGCPPTKDGKPDISPAGIKKLEACLNRVPQTKELWTDETGKYKPERLDLHKKIRANLMKGLVCKTEREKPIAILMGGVPGAGKSTWLKKYAPNMSKDKIFKVDADEIRAMLPEYQGWNSKATHKEARDIYRGLLEDASQGKPCRFDLIWDGTMNRAENYKPLIGDLRKLNYDIYMIYVKISWELSKKRTLERYVKEVERGGKGRYVPMEVVDEANQTGLKGFEELKKLSDGFMVVDGVSGEITEKGGKDILADRGYFDHVPTEKDAKLKLAKAKLKLLELQRKRIAIKLGLEAEKKPEDSGLTPIEKATKKREEFIGSLITSIAPYKEAFLKRKGLSYNDESKLTKSQKDKLSKEWLKSQEYEDMQNRDKKEIWEKYNN